MFAHGDFLERPPPAQVHITTKEPEVAADMVSRSIMTTDSCVNFADITNQRFYVVRVPLEQRLLSLYQRQHVARSDGRYCRVRHSLPVPGCLCCRWAGIRR